MPSPTSRARQFEARIARAAWMGARPAEAVHRWPMEVAGPERTTGPSWRADLREGYHKFWRRSSMAHKRMVWLLLAAGAGLRLFMLKEPVTYDEAFTHTYFAARPFGQIIGDYSYPNNHILHTLLVKISTALFGIGQVQLRLPALAAGMLALPLFYLFARAMFNRYIALMALALVASSGGLIEYSTLARGYSITWLCMTVALLLGRHLAKRDSTPSALLLALACAMGTWSVTTMVYAALAVYAWVGLYLASKYRTSLNRRLRKLLLSLGCYVVLTLLLYAPVVMAHGIGQLVHHPLLGDNTWEHFMATHQDRTFDLWIYFTGTSATWLAVTGLAGLLATLYISSKYRMLVFGAVLGAVPIVLAQRAVGAPAAWTYLLFYIHLGVAVALFYLLKLVQDRVAASFTKRLRTMLASGVIMVVFGVVAVRALPGRTERFTDARQAAAYLRPMLSEGDRVMVASPWDAPLEFYLLARGADPSMLTRAPAPGGELFLVVSPADGQTPASVLLHNGLADDRTVPPRKIKDLKRVEIFTTRMLPRS